MKKIILIQCALCCFLLATAVVLGIRWSKRMQSVGTFAQNKVYNDTFEELSNIYYGELFDE